MQSIVGRRLWWKRPIRMRLADASGLKRRALRSVAVRKRQADDRKPCESTNQIGSPVSDTRLTLLTAGDSSFSLSSSLETSSATKTFSLGKIKRKNNSRTLKDTPSPCGCAAPPDGRFQKQPALTPPVSKGDVRRHAAVTWVRTAILEEDEPRC